MRTWACPVCHQDNFRSRSARNSHKRRCIAREGAVSPLKRNKRRTQSYPTSNRNLNALTQLCFDESCTHIHHSTTTSEKNALAEVSIWLEELRGEHNLSEGAIERMANKLQDLSQRKVLQEMVSGDWDQVKSKSDRWKIIEMLTDFYIPVFEEDNTSVAGLKEMLTMYLSFAGVIEYVRIGANMNFSIFFNFHLMTVIRWKLRN